MLMMSMTTYAQKTPEIYRIFDAQGKEVSYENDQDRVSHRCSILWRNPQLRH